MTIINSNCLFKKISSVRGKTYFTVFLFLFCTAFQTIGYAQTVQGTVTDAAGKPIEAASVVIKKTSKGTVTDKNGVFSISASPGSVLVISSLGFEPKEMTVGNEKNLAISLASTNSELNTVVVTGYGTQKRTAVTGAISTVNSKTINEIPVVSVQQALQGRVPGLSVTNN